MAEEVKFPVNFHPNFPPVVMPLTPDAQATWLISEFYPDDADVAVGLRDLGMGFPELADVRISEIAAIRVQALRPSSGARPLLHRNKDSQ